MKPCTPEAAVMRAVTDLLDVAHFWERVDRSGDCWPWIACRNKYGYGRVGVPGLGTLGAHQVAWLLTGTPIPTGMGVLHRCDNPACVRPSHLFLGTQADNMHDMASKSRAPKGIHHWSRRHPEKMSRGERHSAKLTNEDVLLLRSLREQGADYKTLAVRFGISKQQACKIALRQRWAHVT